MRYWIIAMLVLYCTSTGSTALAQSFGSYYWYQRDGPDGRNAAPFAMAVHRSGAVFAMVPDAVVYRSTNNGLSWEFCLDAGRNHFNAQGSIVCTEDGAILAMSRYLYRSTDAGVTWTRLFDPGEVKAAMVALRLPDGMIIVNTALHGMYRSRDNGSTWQRIRVHPTNSNLTGLHRAENGALIATTLELPFRSTDDGDSWTEMAVPFKRMRSATVGPGRYIYGADFAGGIARTSNGGSSWEVMSQPGPNRLAGSTERGNMFASPSMKRSSDSGRSWFTVFAADVTAFASHGSTAVAALKNSGFVQSTDGGDSWRPMRTRVLSARVRAVSAPDTSHIAAIADDMIWTSSYGDPSWHRTPSVPPGLPLSIQGGATMYVGTDSGLYRSIDTGRRWSRLAIDSEGPIGVTALRMEEALLVGTSDGRLFAGADSVWIDMELRAALPITSIVRTKKGWAIVAAGNRIHRSGNRGLWTEIDPGSSDATINELAVDRSGQVYAATDNGIFFSRDDGVTWTARQSGIEGLSTRSISADTNGLVFTVTTNGISVWLPGPARWATLNVGTPSHVVNTITAVRGAYLVSGTDGDGINKGTYRSSLSGVDDVTVLGLRCYPNPATTHAQLTASITRSGRYRVVICDALGSVAFTLHDADVRVGELELRLPVTDLAHGVWFVDVSGPGTRQVVPLVVGGD